ncbi:YCF48-related protein [Bacteroidota bacterium]
MNVLKISLWVFILSITLSAQLELRNPNPQDSNLLDIFFVDANHGWVVGSNSIVLKTSNGGTNWEVIDTQTNEYFYSVFFINQELGWVTTLYTDKIYKTSNGGETWEDIYTFAGAWVNLRGIYFVNDSTGFIAGSFFDLFKTTDYGYNWEVVPGSFYESSTLEFVNENYGWAGGFNSFKKTTNAGATWTNIDLLTYAFIVYEIDLLDQYNGYLVGYGEDNLGTYYDMFVSTNDGGFSRFYKTFSTPLWNVYFESPNVGWLAGPTMYKTNDGGANWDTLNSSVMDFQFQGVESWGINFDNEILFSDDGWESSSLQFSFTVSVEDESNDFNYDLYQNYPNPFNPTTNIQYTIGNRQFVTLKFYDVLGNEVATLVNEEKPAREYEVEFNGKGLPSGVYFYQLRADSFIQTRKMLLLK